MKKILFTLLALVGIISGVEAQETFFLVNLVEGYNAHAESFSLSALFPDEPEPFDLMEEMPAAVLVGSTVTLSITPEEGYVVTGVTANPYVDVGLLGVRTRNGDSANPDIEIPLTKGDGNTWTFIMPETNVELAVSYAEVKAVEDSWLSVTGTYTYTGEAITPTFTVKDGTTDITEKFDVNLSNNLNAGDATITVTPKTDVTEYSGSASTTFSIAPKAVTITAQSKAFTYTGEAQSWNQYDVEGLVGEDAITAVITGSITLPGESPVTNKVESYEFTAGTPGNYTVTTQNGELTMTNASIAITITAASEEWTYDGIAHNNNTVTVTSGELLVGDVLVAEATGNATNVADTKDGNNPIAEGYKVMHGEEDVTANYVITTVAGKLTITPKAVTITAQSKAFTYTGEAQSWNQYDVEGLVGEDAITAVITGSITLPGESPVTNKVESYEFTAGTPGNYSVTTQDGELTMTAASIAITITAASEEWTYDGIAHNNNTVTVTSGSLLEGDALVAEATGSVTNVADTQAGNNPVAEGYKVMHGETDVTANYVITTVAGKLTIAPKAVTITAQSKAFTYTGEAQSWNQYDVEGLVGDDAITAVITGSITYPSQGAVANKVGSYEFTKGTAGNYSVTTQDGELTMTNASVAITITAASGEWTYDGTAHTNTAVTVTSGSLLEGDVLVATAAGSVTNVADTETGNNPVAEGYKVMHGETDVTASYAITTVAGTLTITPKAVTITSQSEEFTYDGHAHTNANYDVEGLVGDDAIKAVVSESIKYVRENYVENKIVSYEFTKGDPTNYDVKLIGGRLTMLKAKLILTGGITICKNVTNGDVTYSVDCSNVEFNGLVGSDKITISGITISSIEINEDGSETIILGFSNVLLEGDNLDCYEFTTAEGAETVTITKTTETTSEVAEDGTRTETTVAKETTAEGVTTEVVSVTQTDAYGNITATSEKTTETAADGTVTASSETKIEKNNDGSTTETKKTYATSGGSTGGGSGGGSSTGGGGESSSGRTVTTESKTVTNANGDVTSSSKTKEEKDADGNLVSSESSNYQMNEDGSSSEWDKKATWDEDGCKHETENLKETDSGADHPWHEKGSETIFDDLDIALNKTSDESWKYQDEDIFAKCQTEGTRNDVGGWDETLKRSVSDPLGNTLYTSVTNTTTDENDNTWMTSFEELYDPDKGAFIDVLLASAKDEKDFPELTWDADEETEYKNLSGEFADIDKMVVPNEYAANPWVRTDEEILESALENSGLDDAYFQTDNRSNIDVKCKTEFKKEGDAIDREYSYVVNQWTDETNMAVVNEKSGNLFNVEYNEEEPLYDFDAKFDSWKFDDESIFDKFDLHANGTWRDEDNLQTEIWGKEEDLRKISELYSRRRAPEEDENVPEGYIKIESGVDYEVLKEGPIILTIITKGGPMEIKSIKFKDGPGSTAIRDVTYTSGKATADAWYTLDGRKLDKAPTAKGVYIYGGHKVVVK